MLFALRKRSRALLKTTIALVVLLLALSFYAYKIEPSWIQVTTVRVAIPNLAPEFQNYRIVQISDIHVDSWMTEKRLKHIVAIANRQKADLTALTGDFITRDPKKFAPVLEAALKDLKPVNYVVAVLGNHDHWSNPEMVVRSLQAAGVKVLNNEAATLHREAGMLTIAGLDDVWVQAADLEGVLQQLPEQGANVLLVHEPDFADTSAATGRFALQLSGHSHGGQVQIPFWGPPMLPYLGKKYPSGRYQVGNMTVYTNRGVGTVKPKVRFSSRPEITVFVLRSETA